MVVCFSSNIDNDMYQGVLFTLHQAVLKFSNTDKIMVNLKIALASLDFELLLKILIKCVNLIGLT